MENTLNPEIFALHYDISNTVYTVEYKLPKQRKWRYGFSMKSEKGIELALPDWKGGIAVDNLCLSSQIKTRII